MKETKRVAATQTPAPSATTTTTTTPSSSANSNTTTPKTASPTKADAVAVSKTTSTGTIDSSHSSTPADKGSSSPAQVSEPPAPQVHHVEPPKEATPVPVPPAEPEPEAVDISKLDTVSALYNYTADEEGELTFKEGDTIYVISKDPSGWWRGRTVAGAEGDFPSNYVGNPGATPAAGAPAEVKSGEEEADEEETTVDANYRVLYDYEAEEEGELTITQDQVLFVFTERGGWFYGRNEAGQTGLFPSNYVERVET